MTSPLPTFTAVFVPETDETQVHEIQLLSLPGFQSVAEALHLPSEKALDIEGLHGVEGPALCFDKERQHSTDRWHCPNNERATALAGFPIFGNAILVRVRRVRAPSSSPSSSSSSPPSPSSSSNSNIVLESITLEEYTTLRQTKTLLSFNFERNYLRSLRNPKLQKLKRYEKEAEGGEGEGGNEGDSTSSVSTPTPLLDITSIPRHYNPKEWRGKTPKTLLIEYQQRLGPHIIQFEYTRLSPPQGPHISKLTVKYKDEVMEFVSSQPHAILRDSEHDAALEFIHYVLSLRASTNDESHSSSEHSKENNTQQQSSDSFSEPAQTSLSTFTPPLTPSSSPSTTSTPPTSTTLSSTSSSSSSSPPSLSFPSLQLPPQFSFELFQKYKTESSEHSKQLEDLLADGTIIKLKLVEGSGKLIRTGMRVTFHYALKLSDETMCDNSLTKEQPVNERVGQGSLFILDLLLRTMRSGEQAVFYVKYTRGYGELGCPPRIPPRADLLYFVAVLLTTKESRINEEDVPLSDEDRIYKADMHRENGKIFFCAQQYALAYDEYKTGIRFLDPLKLSLEKLSPEYQQCVIELLCILHTNLATTCLRLMDWDAALSHANEALKLNKDLVKPLIRRAEAWIGKYEFEKAQSDLHTAENLLNSLTLNSESTSTRPSLISTNPTTLSNLIQNAKRQLKLREKQYEDESKKMFAKMFKSLPNK